MADVVSHCGRWKCHCIVLVTILGWCYCLICLADVIAFALVVDVKTTTVSWDGWCYCHVADVIATAGWCGWQMLLPVADGKATESFYFSFSSEVSTRTSSQTCGRWYLPTFLFRDGSLTLIYRASFIVLIWFKSSLPIILKLLMVTLWPLMLLWSYMGEGGFRCSLNLSPKVLEDSPIYSSSQSYKQKWKIEKYYIQKYFG